MIAFGFGGTLDSIPALRDYVQQLNHLNIPVACISAVAEESHTEGRRKEIERLTVSDGTPLKFQEVRIFAHPTGADGQVDVARSGKIKALRMGEIGAHTLYDDHPEIIRQLRQRGRRAIEVFPEMTVYPGRPIAFDYGGTLRSDDGKYELREIVRNLNLLRIPVIVISAIEGPEGTHDAKMRDQIAKQVRDVHGHNRRFNEIRFVYYPKDPTPADMVKVGQDKAAIMQEVGAALLFDDSSYVRQGVQQFTTQLHAVGW